MNLTIRPGPDETAACALYGQTAAELAERFAAATLLGQWFAYDGDDAVGVAHATDRADGRVFVTHRLVSDGAFGPLLCAAVEAVDGPLNTTIDETHTDRIATAESIGFERDLTAVRYLVPFDTALSALPGRTASQSFEIVGADEVDPDALFVLDTVIRGDVPGNDGWRGNRAWFDEEISSPEFDPTGYRVAVEHGGLTGLCRMWRNPDGPDLGLLGVVRARRQGVVAGSLLRDTLEGSSSWGWPAFGTHTARRSLQRHLRRVDARRTGAFVRLRRA